MTRDDVEAVIWQTMPSSVTFLGPTARAKVDRILAAMDKYTDAQCSALRRELLKSALEKR